MPLSAKMISLIYKEADAVSIALDQVSVNLPDTGFVAFMGPSGSGKSSLLYILSGLKRASSGQTFLDGADYSRLSDTQLAKLRRNSFGFVFQQPFLLNHLTARENVEVSSGIGSKGSDTVTALLQSLGVDHLADRRPTHLSGGERQRIAVARALAHEPRILFADEPTAALDRTNGHAVIDLMASYRKRGLVLLVTHDPAMAENADLIYHMENGRLAE